MKIGMIFCIDGGGTKTRGKLFSLRGETVAQAEGGPGNVSTDPLGSSHNVKEVWTLCARSANLDPNELDDICVSIGAAGTLPRTKREIFLQSLPRFGETFLMTDGHAAMIGAGGGLPCGLIIAGTGAAGHRLYPDGSSIRRDGWGWIAGDRGAGAWIGRKVLRHAIEVYDGLVPATPLARLTLERLKKAGGVSQALTGIKPDQIAAFTPLAFETARQGDAVAKNIIEHAVRHLARLAHVLDIGQDTPLYLTGGLASEFRELLANELKLDVSLPHADALYGSYLVATGAGPSEKVSISSYDEGVFFHGQQEPSRIS